MVPELETARLTLRPRAPSDIEAFVAMDSDDVIRRYLPPKFRDTFHAADYRAALPERMAADHGPGLGHWTLRLKDEAQSFVGTVLLIPVEGTGPDIEIGWRLPQAAWGQGYAREAARAVIDHAFGTLGLAAVVALIHADNVRSAALAERLGLRRVGRRAAYGTTFDLYSLARPA